ncbi:MAG: hypothetical protein ABSC05_28490 [Candidatus Solibacter sp.]|jgi:hypothetical protein
MITASRKLFLLHLVANALLLWLAYEWLGVGESTRLRLVWSALAALAILALACWLHGATLVFFRASEPKIGGAFRTVLRSVPALLVAAILVLVLYALLAWAAAASEPPAFRLASWLTLKLRTPVKPATVARIFLAAFWIVRWVVVPVALLPMASGIAARGWRGYGEFSWRGGWRYWLEVPLLLVAGLLLPFVVLGWVPAVSGFTLEMVSFAVRMLVAYLLFVSALWMLEWRTAARKDAPSA